MKGYILLWSRIVLGVLFSIAGVAKIVNLDEFIVTLSAYQILPSQTVMPAALAVATLETGLGTALVAGFFTRQVALALGLLVSLFLIVISLSMMKGTAAECGCFGTLVPEPIGPGIMARDIIVLIACVLLFREERHCFTIDSLMRDSNSTDTM